MQIKIPGRFFVDTEKLILKFIWKGIETVIANAAFKNIYWEESFHSVGSQYILPQ